MSSLHSLLYLIVVMFLVLSVGSTVFFYAGGMFTIADGVSANYTARWDGTTWHPLGEGLGGGVEALTVDRQGNLFAGGYFTTAGGGSAHYTALWDGATWHPLGEGMDGSVHALAFDGHAALFAGGEFDFAGGKPSWDIGRWQYILTNKYQIALPTILRR